MVFLFFLSIILYPDNDLKRNERPRSGEEGPARPVDERSGPTGAERRPLVQIQSHRLNESTVNSRVYSVFYCCCDLWRMHFFAIWDTFGHHLINEA